MKLLNNFFNAGIPPAFLFIFGSFLIPFFKGRAKSVYMILLPIIAFCTFANLPDGYYWNVEFLNYNLVFGKTDHFNRAFGYIFILISFIPESLKAGLILATYCNT